MKNRIPVAVHVATAAVLIFAILVGVNAPAGLVHGLFFISPVLIVWMVFSVLRSKSFTGTDLKEDEEWGYSDKRREDLGTF